MLRGRAYWKILFVGKDQKKGIPKFVFIQHPLQLLPGLNNTISVVAINHENDALSILEIVSPQGSNFVLSTHVPHSELNVLVFYSLNVETNCGNRGNNFTKSAGVSIICELVVLDPTSTCTGWWSFRLHRDRP